MELKNVSFTKIPPIEICKDFYYFLCLNLTLKIVTLEFFVFQVTALRQILTPNSGGLLFSDLVRLR